jgi:hypothetical protein
MADAVGILGGVEWRLGHTVPAQIEGHDTEVVLQRAVLLPSSSRDGSATSHV